MQNKFTISRRGNLAPYSPIRKLMPFADKAKAEGVKIYHLNIGQPDFEVPELVKFAIKKYSDLTYLPYSHSQGYADLIQSWQNYLKDIRISGIKPSDILITTGASEALIFAVAAICDPGEELLVFEPFYANYQGFANLVSAKVIPVTLDKNNGYHLPPETEITAKITKKTRGVLFANPNNPTGTVFDRKELELIFKIAKEYNLFLISDETYFGLTFDNRKSISFYHIAKGEDRDRIVLIDSLSKRLNVCGARVGAIISTNKDFMSAVLRFAQERLAVATLDQMITSEALADSIGYVKKIAKEYQKRRDSFIGTLEKEMSTKIHYPEGAFYTMLKLPIKNADDFAKWLLTDFRYNNETVMVAPGSGFYASGGGQDEVRVAYVLKVSELKKAAKLLALAVKEYSDK